MDERGTRDNRGGRLKVFAGLIAIAFSAVLAVIVGSRLSNEALSVLAGTVCGVGAAIPTSLLIVSVTRRRDEPRAQTSYPGNYPPVVVVTAPGNHQQPSMWGALPSSVGLSADRHFTVVGGPSGEREVGARERYS